MEVVYAKSLLERFPQFFGTFIDNYAHPEHQFSVSDGWASLVFSACLELETLRHVEKEVRNITINVDIIQIKEKFGTLRMYHTVSIDGETVVSKYFRKIDSFVKDQMCKRGFYKKYWEFTRWRRKNLYETIFEEVDTIISRYEFMSNKICELCGDRGRRCCPSGHWVETLCEQCEKTEKEKKENKHES